MLGNDFSAHIVGRWGVKIILWFKDTLGFKSLWRGIFGQIFWKDILHSKYLYNNPLSLYILFQCKHYKRASPFWSGMVKVYSWIGVILAWKVENAYMIQLGLDLLLGNMDVQVEAWCGR